MSILTFLIGWLFHEDFVQEQEELQRCDARVERSGR